MDKNIFISYIEEDKKVAELIWDRLTQKGFRPWAYTKNGSLNWKREIVKKLKKSDIMILVFSKKADQKADKQIVKELSLASEYQKEIIPFMIDDFSPKDITNEAVAYEIIGGSRTWIEKEQPIEKQIDKLISRIFNLFKDTTNDNYLIEENFNFTTNEDPNNIPTLLVTNKTGLDFVDKININSNSSLAFNIHYYGWHYGMKNPKVFINSLHNMNFKKGEKIKVHAKVTADNLKFSEGTVEIVFDEDLKLILEHISWQENMCKSTQCESKIKGNKLKIFSKEGLKLRDIPMKDSNDYFGNIVVKYKLQKVERKNKSKLTPNMDDNIATLDVTNIRGSSKAWYSFVHINPSDLLSFNLHYNTKYMGGKNVRAYIDNLNNKIFNFGDKVTVYGRVSAENLDDAIGKVEVFFNKKVKLVFHSLSWQKWPCTNQKCESPINGNINDIFTEKGLLIGDILKNDDSHYSGNIVIAYMVINVNSNSN